MRVRKERFACQKCPAFYECCKPHMKATAGALDFQDHGYTWWLTEKAVMANTEGTGERI